MNCPTCNREMVKLFLSAACDYCDGLVKQEYYTGYVLYRGPDIHPEYVFRTVAGAESFKTKIESDSPIKRVGSVSPFTWIVSKGILQGVWIADSTYEIYPDHRYPIGEKIAHIYEGGSF